MHPIMTRVIRAAGRAARARGPDLVLKRERRAALSGGPRVARPEPVILGTGARSDRIRRHARPGGAVVGRRQGCYFVLLMIAIAFFSAVLRSADNPRPARLM